MQEKEKIFAKFKGCASDKLLIQLMEWQYNHHDNDLVKELARILKRY